MAFFNNLINNGIASAVTEAYELQKLDYLIEEIFKDYKIHMKEDVCLSIYETKCNKITKNNKKIN